MASCASFRHSPMCIYLAESRTLDIFTDPLAYANMSAHRLTRCWSSSASASSEVLITVVSFRHQKLHKYREWAIQFYSVERREKSKYHGNHRANKTGGVSITLQLLTKRSATDTGYLKVPSSVHFEVLYPVGPVSVKGVKSLPSLYMYSMQLWRLNVYFD